MVWRFWLCSKVVDLDQLRLLMLSIKVFQEQMNIMSKENMKSQNWISFMVLGRTYIKNNLLDRFMFASRFMDPNSVCLFLTICIGVIKKSGQVEKSIFIFELLIETFNWCLISDCSNSKLKDKGWLLGKTNLISIPENQRFGNLRQFGIDSRRHFINDLF